MISRGDIPGVRAGAINMGMAIEAISNWLEAGAGFILLSVAVATLTNCLLRYLFFGTIFVLASAATAEATDIMVNPGDDLAALVERSPPRTRFVLLPGKHYAGGIQPKEGQSFVGRPKAVLSGAVRLTPFVRDGRFWRAKGPQPQPPSAGECERNVETCLFSEVLFVDGVPQRRVLRSSELGKNTWLQNRKTGDVVVGFDPTGRLVEMSYRRAAFYGPAPNVTIRGLVIEQYASTAQHGAIQALDPEEKLTATGWQVIDNDIRFNSGAAVRTGDFMRIEDNRIFKNGQIGITGLGTGIVVVANDIIDNNTLGFTPNWEAGGTKFVRTNLLVVKNNCVHGNKGPGIWTDIENHDVTIVGNWAFDNDGVGIYHEIGGRAVIKDNVSVRNGSSGDSPWHSQILVSGSVHTLVQGNRVEVAAGYGNGIFVVEEGRKNELLEHIHDFPTYVSRGNVVAHNQITFAGKAGVSGFSSNGSVKSLSEYNRFEQNDISILAGPLERFRLGNETLSIKEAQLKGQEVRSRVEIGRSRSSLGDHTISCPPDVGRHRTP